MALGIKKGFIWVVLGVLGVMLGKVPVDLLPVDIIVVQIFARNVKTRAADFLASVKTNFANRVTESTITLHRGPSNKLPTYQSNCISPVVYVSAFFVSNGHFSIEKAQFCRVSGARRAAG